MHWVLSHPQLSHMFPLPQTHVQSDCAAPRTLVQCEDWVLSIKTLHVQFGSQRITLKCSEISMVVETTSKGWDMFFFWPCCTRLKGHLPPCHLNCKGPTICPSTMFQNRNRNAMFGIVTEPVQDLLEAIQVALVFEPPGKRQWFCYCNHCLSRPKKNPLGQCNIVDPWRIGKTDPWPEWFVYNMVHEYDDKLLSHYHCMIYLLISTVKK